MHICFLCNEYPPSLHGGVGSLTQTLGRALVDRGHRVTVVGVQNQKHDSSETDQGVSVIRLAHAPLRGTAFVVHSSRLRRVLFDIHRRSQIDVLEGPELSLALIPKSLRPAKIIRMSGGHHFFSVTLGKTPRPWRSWLERRSFGHSDFLCAVSQFVAETTRDLLGLGNRPIAILPNPVDTAVFKPRRQVPEESALIVFVGTICEKKGIFELIQAMPQIVREVPDARLWLVGRDSQDPKTGGSFIDRLRGLISSDLAEHIFFKGAIENGQLPEILAKAQVCVFPSHMEAQGIVVLEGMAMGKAVVTTETGPGAEVVEDGVSGLLCNPFNPRSIATKTIQLLRDSDLRSRLGEQARSRVVEKFALDVLVKRNEDFYEACLKE